MSISQEVISEKIREDFDPFVWEGLVSLDGDDVDPTPVTIMRDTCCAQCMILEGQCPFAPKSATSESVLVQGIGMNIISYDLFEVSDDKRGDDGDPSLGLENIFMARLDEMGDLPFLGGAKVTHLTMCSVVMVM